MSSKLPGADAGSRTHRVSATASSASVADTCTFTAAVYQPSLPVGLDGVSVIELVGAVVSTGGGGAQLSVVHVTLSVPSRAIDWLLLFTPAARYVIEPVPSPVVEELTVTIDKTRPSADTLLLIVLLESEPQLDGSVNVASAPSEAESPAPLVDRMLMETLEPFLKTFVDPALPLRLIAMSTFFCVAWSQPTVPNGRLLFSVTGVTPSPSMIVLSAYA